MSIRRKTTTYDLATLRLHPDGSRVQQANPGRHTAASTAIDSRGNWIAKDAGGKISVERRRNINPHDTGDAGGEFIDLSSDEDDAPRQGKGKQRARDSPTLAQNALQESETERLSRRARQRLSFMHDLSFLDPPPASASSLETGLGYSDGPFAGESIVPLLDPAPDLLKAVHHFTSSYYLERGQLSDSGKSYHREKKASDTDSETTGTEEETTKDDEDENEVDKVMDSGKGGLHTKANSYSKNMYKAFDGSALVAIGVVLQEYVAHTLLSRPQTPEELRRAKRRRTET